jgi:hypothetical protein
VKNDRRFHGERGATLILAIAFMVVIGGIGAAVVSSVTSSFRGRVVLDLVRDKQYAADAGVEYAIGQVRAKPLPGPAKLFCGQDITTRPDYYIRPAFNGVPIRVDCSNQWGATTTLFEQRNVIFTACVDVTPTTKCGQPTTPIVVRAQINYEAVSAGSVLNVTRTWVQSWSVNR